VAATRAYAVVAIDLPPDAPLGGVLTASTCGGLSFSQAVRLTLGHGCPSAAAAVATPPGGRFSCIGGSLTAQTCGHAAVVTTPVTASRRVYALIDIPDANNGYPYRYRLAYAYFPPSPAMPGGDSPSPSPPACAAPGGVITLPAGPTLSSTRVVINSTSPTLGFGTGYFPDDVSETGAQIGAGDHVRVLRVDVGPGVPLGGTLMLSTCHFDNATNDPNSYSQPKMVLTFDCPSSPAAVADEALVGGGGTLHYMLGAPVCDGPAPWRYAQAGARVVGLSRRWVYVVLTIDNYGYGTADVVNLGYAYMPPPSTTPSGTASPSVSPSGTATPSASGTATPSVSPSGTATPSLSPSGTRSRSPSHTRTPSRSGTPPPTPTPTPMCKAPVNNVTSLRGTAGTAAPVDVGRYGNTGMYTAGSCSSGFQTFFAGPRAVFFLDLGAATPLGGVLTVTTCGHTANNTVLYVGTGCPTWYLPFGCRAGNDNAGDAAEQAGCDANPLASTVTLAPTSARVYFLQLGGYLGAGVTSGLSWRYEPPRSPSATRSGSGTGSATRSRTRLRPSTASATASRTATRSRTRKPK
jgi:hypothetical protein